MNKIIQGDVRAVLPTLPDDSIDCVVTSPPYWGLRDYGVEGQIGLEQNVEAYLEIIVGVFAEVRRVLRPEGTLWLNLGDSYAGSWGQYGHGKHARYRRDPSIRTPGTYPQEGIKPKDLVGIPWRVAFALQADGWYLRSDIIWSKPNPMPESVKDRPGGAHEYIFLMAKSPRYYYDGEAIREPVTGGAHPKGEGAAGQTPKANRTPSWDVAGAGPKSRSRAEYQEAIGTTHEGPTRKGRTVWTINVFGFKGSHYATFPPELARRCIIAGTSAFGMCEKCGRPYRRIVKTTYKNPGNRSNNGPRSTTNRKFSPGFEKRLELESETLGWEQSCKCDNAGTRKPVVFDPFMGSGTVAIVALKCDRNYLGIELNPRDVRLARQRINDEVPLFAAAGESLKSLPDENLKSLPAPTSPTPGPGSAQQ